MMKREREGEIMKDKMLPKKVSELRRRDKESHLPTTASSSKVDEIQRIKAGNPDISHREAFSAAAK
ncbi:hypothetical protein Gohar_015520, partial [Gossypium harknessii]|nr:hypothetical protein [Gossypium harknessii]